MNDHCLPQAYDVRTFHHSPPRRHCHHRRPFAPSSGTRCTREASRSRAPPSLTPTFSDGCYIGPEVGKQVRDDELNERRWRLAEEILREKLK